MALTNRPERPPHFYRVALVADLLEEGWPSMDLVAAMLAQGIKACPSNNFEVEIVRAKMLRCFSKTNRGTGFMVDRALNRFVNYPRYVRHKRSVYDVFHIVDHSYSQLVHNLPANRTVVTCHDLDTFRCLWEPNRAGRGLLFRTMTRRILSGFQNAAHVCCDSAATRNEILARKLLPGERASVVPLGVHPIFSQSPSPDVIATVDAMLGEQNSSNIFLLHVGSTIARKRIDVLLEIFARLYRDDSRLRLLRVGGEFTHAQRFQVARLGIAHAIRVLPFLSTAQLAAVYRRAALVPLPSDAEGFGFPVIEAMTSGTPVVISDLPALREVGGSSAEYAGPCNVEAWVKKIEQLLRERDLEPARWHERQKLCRQQAAKFTWEQTAGLTVDIYKRVLSANKPGLHR